MNAKTVCNTIFHLHRILGLAVGLVLILVGLTGSLLVFQHEINHWQVEQQFGHVVPQAQQISVPALLDTVQTTFANQPDLKLLGINTLPDAHIPTAPCLKPLTTNSPKSSSIPTPERSSVPASGMTP